MTTDVKYGVVVVGVDLRQLLRCGELLLYGLIAEELDTFIIVFEGL